MADTPIVPEVNFPRILRRSQFIHIKKGTSPEYNYVEEDFVQTPEGRIIENESCTFKQIVMNSLLTPRGVYPIYDFSFGSDIHQLISQHPDYVKARLPNMVKEALQGNPRVGRVNVSGISVEGTKIFFTVAVTDSLTGVRFDLNLDVGV